MKPYGSKRSLDTEPRIKGGRALVKREGLKVADESAESAVEDPREDIGTEPNPVDDAAWAWWNERGPRSILRLLEEFAKSMKEEGFTPPLHIQLCASDWIALLVEAGQLTRECVDGVELLTYSKPPQSRLELVVQGHIMSVSPAPWPVL